MALHNGLPLCPECLEETEQDELDTFGGYCEGCSEAGLQ